MAALQRARRIAGVVGVLLVVVGCARRSATTLPATLPPGSPSVPTAVQWTPLPIDSVTPSEQPIPTATPTQFVLTVTIVSPTALPSTPIAAPSPTAPTVTTVPTPTAVPPPPTVTGAPVETVTPPTPDLTVEQPEMVTRQEWGAQPPGGEYLPHTPERITLHEDGVFFDGDPIQRLRTIQRYAMQTRGWVDTPYHFLIDRQGVIYEGRPVAVVGDTATDYDPTGHVSVTLLGDYDVQETTPAQVEALVALAGWLCLAYDIPPEAIAGHRDYAATSCPGETVYTGYLENGLLIELVRQRIQASG